MPEHVAVKDSSSNSNKRQQQLSAYGSSMNSSAFVRKQNLVVYRSPFIFANWILAKINTESHKKVKERHDELLEEYKEGNIKHGLNQLKKSEPIVVRNKRELIEESKDEAPKSHLRQLVESRSFSMSSIYMSPASRAHSNSFKGILRDKAKKVMMG